MKGSRSSRILSRSAVLLAALVLTSVSFQTLDTSARIDRGERFVPDAESLSLASLGFDALLSDFYWLTALQLVGDDSKPADPVVIARLIDAVTTLDPWVGHPYRFAAVWLTDSLESVRAANRILARGVSYAPTDWRNRHYLGFNHFFYLGRKAEAAEILERALGLPGTPHYLARLVAKLKQHDGGLETAGAFLATLIETTEDPYAQAEYLKAMDEVDTERRARLLDQARTVYVQRHGRDIEQIGDLLGGPEPVLRRLPPAHPHFGSFGWEISAETGEIVSTYYKARYRPHEHWFDRERRNRWLEEAQES